MSRPLLLAAIAVVLAAGAVGCDGPGPDGATTDVTVYLARGEDVAPVRRSVSAAAAVEAATVEELLAGPTDAEREAGYGTLVPAGTELLDVSVDGGVATVDLSSAFASGGGSLSMLLRVAQVVYTLTALPGIDRVEFRLDGEPAEAIGGEGVSVSPPVDRSAFEEVTPQILVEEPLPGDVVAAPLRIRGTANVFEATVSLEVVGGDGSVLARTFTTATAGTGTRGTFAASVPLPDGQTGPIRLVAYEASAEDGSRLHVVDVPLELAG